MALWRGISRLIRIRTLVARLLRSQSRQQSWGARRIRSVVHVIRKERTMQSRHRRPLLTSIFQRAGFMLVAALLFGGSAVAPLRAAQISFAPPVSYAMPGASGITAVD